MKRLALITVILGSALALVPFASAMVVSDGGGGTAFATDSNSNVNPATQAVLLRSEGLANHYGAPATRAVVLRNKGLSDYYSANAVTFQTDTLGGKAAPDSLPISTGNSFDWSNALAVTLAAMLILGIAATTLTRRDRLSY